MKILFLSSEADPFIKVGGLGDVGGSLPNALMDLNQDLDVRLVIPFHSAIQMEKFDLHREIVFTIPRNGEDVPVQVFHTERNGLPVYFISGDPFNHSTKVYDTDAAVDGEKFVYFCMAALELARKLDFKPDIVHANDWHTAAALYGVKLKQLDPFWVGVKTLLTIHNLCYMGAGSEAAMTAYGLPPLNDPSIPWWGQQTPLPVGLFSADHVVAVSPSYAEEIQTPEYGCGLENYLRNRHENLSGIVNGIDTESWNPVDDYALAKNYSVKSISDRLENKLNLQGQFGLKVDGSIPLLAMVTRMDQQKGVDIALESLRLIQELDWQAILLGSGNPEIESTARRLESDFPDRVCAIIRYDGTLSRQIYGGSDMLMMPSRYEPCGLAQLIAMRYGSVPVARATGGLRDTIAEGSTGFLFTDASAGLMAGALRRAIKVYQDNKKWRIIQQTGMSGDYSWKISASQYFDCYQNLLLR
ncbi:MAG: glycogen/starch synthase [Chloroflexota bacterium]